MISAASPYTTTFMEKDHAFDATIPVVDMNDFKNPFKRADFVDKVSKALHEVGFFAVVNPGVDSDVLKKGYQAVINFFRSSQEEKMKLFNKATNGQRGYVPSEIAQGAIKMDFKEFLHVGMDKNIWPEGTEDLRDILELLFSALNQHNHALEETFSQGCEKNPDFFTHMTCGGDNLLRAIHYFKNPGDAPWAAEHTDIDLFTILPMATEEGLQVWDEKGWIDVRVPRNAFIVNAGDMLENITNGYFKSARHRVISKKEETERFSIVLFTHPAGQQRLDPLPHFIAKTGGVQRYPSTTAMALKARRLIELGLGSDELKEYDRKSGLIDRVRELVESGAAAPAVKKTYEVYLKSLQAQS